MSSEKHPDCESPRTVSRGLNSQIEQEGTVCVGGHWLRGSFPADRIPEMTEFLRQWFGAEWEPKAYGMYTYDRSFRWPNGVMLHFQSTPERAASLTNGKATIEVPGSALDSLGMEAVCLLFVALRWFEFSPSRLDVFFDDDERSITPGSLYSTIYETTSEGEVIRRDFTGFRRIRHICEGDNVGRTHDECSFGRRGRVGGGKYLRVYDKKLESKGENNSIRWELELSDDHAKSAYSLLVASYAQEGGGPEAVAAAIGTLIGGCIDFRQRDGRAGSKNIGRLARYPFWERIIAKLGKAKLAREQPPKSVPKARRYIETQVAGSLQMLRKAMQPEMFFTWLRKIVTREDKLRPAHLAALDEYQRAQAGNSRLDIAEIREYCDAEGIQLEWPTVAEEEGSEPGPAWDGREPDDDRWERG